MIVLLVFGIGVSIVGFVRAPAVHLRPIADSSVRINEITQLFPVTMARVVAPRTVAEISAAVASSPGPISIGGGRYSMGGQTATPDGLQLDMRNFRGIVAFDPTARTITVHSGTRWRDVQRAIDRAGLSVKIMQTYNTFTVGGSLSVNSHGRYIGQGPLVRSVRSLTLVLADGRVVTASPTENADLFYGAIGGYGALGVIADVTLDLAVDDHVRRDDSTMVTTAYPTYFRANIRPDTSVVFHNADLYPPDYQRIHAVSYRATTAPVTIDEHIQPADQAAWTHRLAYRMMASGTAGLWMREHVIDPWIFRGNPVEWRNYEASYDVSELEPSSRAEKTYVLQEYFVPVDSFGVFVPRMRRVLQRHHVNVINISVRHALPDPGTMLAWAPTEVFAYVLYYRQGTTPEDRREVGTWTRELIDAAERTGGRYYLPYQPVATRAQFLRGYPRAPQLFATKQRVDPTGKFTNVLWDLYTVQTDGTVPPVTASHMPSVLSGEIRQSIDTIGTYVRSQGDEYLTHPEWDLVYSSEAYEQWLAAGRLPSQFPYEQSVGTFWRGYVETWRASRRQYPTEVGTHVMLGVIGVSTAIEYGLKGLYEISIGRLSEHARPAKGTAEERYAAHVAHEYSELIIDRGWYEFDFLHALRGLWSDVPLTGDGMARKWERRFALTLEYGLKAAYGSIIKLGTQSAYTPDVLARDFVVAGWSDSLAQSVRARGIPVTVVRPLDRGYTLLSVPRYLPFRDALLSLSDDARSLRIAEVSGCDVVTITGIAPARWRPPARTRPIVAYTTPANAKTVRVLLGIRARDLLDVLAEIRREHALQVDHIYDY